MKIAILGPIAPEEKKFWQQTARNLGHKLDWVEMRSVMIKVDKNRGVKISALIYEKDKRRVVNMLDYDCILRRWIKKYYVQSLILCSLLQKEGKIVINSKIDRIQDKITQAFKLSVAGLPHPTTYQVLRPKRLREVLDKIKYPAILKQIEGALGMQVYLVNSRTSAVKILNKYKMYNVLIQEYFPVKEDFRVFVVGNKVLGAMKRMAIAGEYRNNVARGAFTEKAELTQELKELALRAARVLEYEIAGVDIMYYKGKPYILEVNRTPQFKGFMKTMGINVAEEIIKYLEKLYLKGNSDH